MAELQNVEQYLEELMAEYPICEYAFGDPKDIPFSKEVLHICITDCPRYGHSWSCPPSAGDIQENMALVSSYSRFLVFSTVHEVADAWNFDACLAVRKEHERMTRDFRKKLLEHYNLPLTELHPASEAAEAREPAPFYVLSAGCSLCDDCTYPDAPCRNPKERLQSMESHGILILKLVDDLNLTFQYDSTTVVYFSMILF